MRKIILLMSIIVVLFSTTTVFAEECSVECTAEMIGEKVCISGRITNATQSYQVALLVGDIENILHIDEKATEDDGSFNFTFGFVDRVKSGTYDFMIGTSAGTELYKDVLVYTTNNRIVCQPTIDGRNVSISGQILNATTTNNVSLMVGDGTNVIYTAQTTSEDDGKFEFNFKLPVTLPSDIYSFTINADTENAAYRDLLIYESSVEFVESQFFDGNFTVSLSNYIPTILGSISRVNGKEITFNVINSSDNTVIAQDTITSEDGKCTFNYTLPSLITGKDYIIVISCADETKNLFNLNVEINSSIILVSVNGNIQVADDVELEANIQTTNSDLINKSVTITSNETISSTIPNLVANMSCDIDIKAVEFLEIERVYFFTKNENLKIDWLYTSTVEQFYSAGGNLYKFESGTETKLLENVEAKFIVSDNTHVYFSNMTDDGRIYRCTKDGKELSKICDARASWLSMKNGRLYYTDNKNNRTEKSISIAE